MAQRNSARQVLRVFPDYQAYPVWNSDGASVMPSGLPVSTGLREGLLRWRQQWEELMGVSEARYSIVDQAAYDRWEAEGRDLSERLGRELGPRYEVVYEP